HTRFSRDWSSDVCSSDLQWKTIKLGMASVALALLTLSVQAQEQHSNANVRLGQKALLDGDFKGAAAHLQKALPAEANDPDVQYRSEERRVGKESGWRWET